MDLCFDETLLILDSCLGAGNLEVKFLALERFRLNVRLYVWRELRYGCRDVVMTSTVNGMDDIRFLWKVDSYTIYWCAVLREKDAHIVDGFIAIISIFVQVILLYNGNRTEPNIFPL